MLPEKVGQVLEVWKVAEVEVCPNFNHPLPLVVLS